MKPVAIQPVIWRYILQNGERTNQFLRHGFPFVLYCYPSNTFSGLFQELSFLLSRNYTGEFKKFQGRLKQLIPLVYFDSVKSQKRARPSDEKPHPSTETLLLDPLSWTQLPPFLPVLNYPYYQSNRLKDPTVSWLRYVFRKDHMDKKLSHFIKFDNTKSIHTLMLVLDVDEGECGEHHNKTLMSTDSWPTRSNCLKAEESRGLFPKYSAELSNVSAESKPGIALELYIERYMKARELKDEKCPKCQQTILSRSLAFYSLPRYLSFHLQRAMYDQFKKDKVITNVSYPLEGLDLSAYYTSEKNRECLYDLLGVLCHSTACDHFYVICRDNVEGEVRWVKYDNDKVKYVQVGDVVSPEAYLLVYVKRKKNYVTGMTLRDLILKFAEE